MLSTDEVVMGRPGQHEGPGLCLPGRFRRNALENPPSQIISNPDFQ